MTSLLLPNLDAPKPLPGLLASLLSEIKVSDTQYARRYGLILQAMAIAHVLGYQVGMRIDPKEPNWPAVFIELPTGQVSWHMPQHPYPWDGHDDDTKFERINQFIAGVQPNGS